tara:strand:- start:58 stop:690 length:633 start_codon:yes stop_codon:yes gene_type:complete
MGTDGAAGNTHDINLYYAKSINGVAPASFGTGHAVNTEDLTAAFRRNLIGFTFIDTSSVDDADQLRAYNILGMRSSSSADGVAEGGYNAGVILQGEPNATRTGFQTIYIAGLTRGAFDFGTEIDLNMAASANVDADTTGASVVLTTSGTDPRHVFQPGDIVVGHTGTTEMEVVSVDSATQMTVKNITAQIDHAEELLPKNPVKIFLGIEY